MWGDMHWGNGTPDRLKNRLIPYEGLQRFWIDAGLPFNSRGLVGPEALTAEIIRKVRRRYADLEREWFWKQSMEHRILDKTPTYILMIEAIDRVFPDAFHIFCIRDPRAVLNSILRIHRFPERSPGPIAQTGFWSVIPPGYEAHTNEPLVERLCWQIEALHEIGLESRKMLGERLVEFHYEWLLEDAHGSAMALFDRIELPEFPGIKELIPPAFSYYSPPWPRPGAPVAEPYGKRRCYTDEEVGSLSRLDVLVARLGYDRYVVGVLDGGHICG